MESERVWLAGTGERLLLSRSILFLFQEAAWFSKDENFFQGLETRLAGEAGQA
jgi:hypothetical protein